MLMYEINMYIHEHKGCFAHTLQLVIHNGMLSQMVVIDILANSRKTAGHFRCFCVAYSRWKEIQKVYM